MNSAYLKELAQQYVGGLITDVEFLHQVQMPKVVQERLAQLIKMPPAAYTRVNIEHLMPIQDSVASFDDAARAAAAELATVSVFFKKLRQFTLGDTKIDPNTWINPKIGYHEGDEDEPNYYRFLFDKQEHAYMFHVTVSTELGRSEGAQVEIHPGKTWTEVVVPDYALRRHGLEVPADILAK